jgi:hypothetical protein
MEMAGSVVSNLRARALQTLAAPRQLLDPLANLVCAALLLLGALLAFTALIAVWFRA